MSEPAVLECRNLRKAFPRSGTRRGRATAGARREEVLAVRDVSLALHAGQVVALVGESGSGKSTIARLLMGLYPSDAGSILLSGKTIDPHARRARQNYRRAVQMVFQDPFSSLNPLHTVGYHLSRPLRNYAREPHGARASLPDQLEELLATVHLSPASQFLGRRPHELSGGQRQRIAVARALAARPIALLADEPVSMLDVSVRLGILNLLRDLSDSRGLAVLYITHDIASARYFADDIAVMYSGEVVEQGSAEVVTQQPRHPYSRLLLESVPTPARRLRDRRNESPGEDSIKKLPGANGCRFLERCPYAEMQCAHVEPELQTVGDGRVVRCLVVQREGVLPRVHRARST